MNTLHMIKQKIEKEQRLRAAQISHTAKTVCYVRS